MEPSQEGMDKEQGTEGPGSKGASSRPAPKPGQQARSEEEGAGATVNMDLILDIPVTVSIELGRTRVAVADILQLGQGSVLELDKLAGEPLEVLVQGRIIGKGEVVVVNEKFGIRLTDVISPAERVESLA